MKMIAMGIHHPRISQESEVSWLDDPFYFDLSIGTALAILEAIRPKGDITMPENKTVALITNARAAGLAPQLWENVLQADPALPITKGSQLEHWFAMAKADLGNIPDRAEQTIEDYWDGVFSEPQPKKKRKRKT